MRIQEWARIILWMENSEKEESAMDEKKIYTREELIELRNTDYEKYRDIFYELVGTVGGYVIKKDTDLPDEDRTEPLSGGFWDGKIREYIEYAYNGYVHACVHGGNGVPDRNYYEEDVERSRETNCERILYTEESKDGAVRIVASRPQDEEAAKFMIFMLSAVYENLVINLKRFPNSFRMNRHGEYVCYYGDPTEKFKTDLEMVENLGISMSFDQMMIRILSPNIMNRNHVISEISSNATYSLSYIEAFKQESISEDARIRVVNRLSSF